MFARMRWFLNHPPVMVVGGVVIGPALEAMLHGRGDTTARLIGAAAYGVLALALATALSVFKPGRPFRVRETPSKASA